MKVKIIKDTQAPSWGEVCSVYGFYNIGGNLYFLLIPSKHEGLLAYSTKEVEVVDPVVGDDIVVTKTGASNDYIFLNKTIAEFELYERLIECEPNAYVILREEEQKINGVTH